jgi:hypothetical protein
VHKVLGILRDWTRGDGLTDDQVDVIDAYYTSLKDCDYLGMSLKGQCHESVSPKPLSVPLGPFQIFLKILRDIRS